MTSRSRITLLVLCVAAVVAGEGIVGPLHADEQSPAGGPVWSMAPVQPLFTKYCAGCHNSEKHKGEFDVTAFDSQTSMLQERKIWQHVLRVLRDEEMPPKDPLPTAEERQQLIRWVDDTINNIDWSKHRHAGHVTIPRLTREEYNNSLRDLLGLDLRPGDNFSVDGQGESGFDNDRDALFITPAQMEKYLAAADRALDAVLALEHEPVETRLESENMFMTETRETPKQLDDSFFGYVINRGQMTLYESVRFPYDGFYEFTIRAKSTSGPTGAQLGINSRAMANVTVPSTEADEYTVTCFVPAGSHQMTWNINKPPLPPKSKQKKPQKKTEYTQLPDNAGKVVSQQSKKNAPQWPLTGDESPEVTKLAQRVNTVSAGVQRPYEWLRLHGENGEPLQLRRFRGYIIDRRKGLEKAKDTLAKALDVSREEFDRRFAEHNRETLAANDRLFKMSETVQDTIDRKPGSVAIDWINIRGPVRPGDADPLAEIFFVESGDGLSSTDAARQVITKFASRAFRRPADAAEIEPFLSLFERGQQRGDAFRQSVKLALTGILVSPKFLFRLEQGPTDGDYALDQYALASRLSYFLWLSMPDQELFRLADLGTLSQPDVLRRQVRRMLDDPKSRAFTQAFLGQWLGYANLGESVIPDAKRFPEFNDELNAAMQEETVLLFESLLRERGSLLELLDTDRTYLNEQLARHYGIGGVTGDTMQPVVLTDRSRGGLLGMASVLTATSSPTRTSPVLRGKWVLETLLGEPAGDPPPDAGALPGDAGQKKGLTLREEFLQHRRDPSCAACHDKIDPLGFGLENFDAIGRFRDTQNGQPINATGQLPDGTTFDGPTELKQYLLTYRKDDFLRNLAERMLSFALGRELRYYDEPAIGRIITVVRAADGDASALVTEIILSYPFRHQNSNVEPK